ncbi:MAG: tripartite tricarboxylate transporter substrate binding protein [Betaproteobacteria bacterium]|nr:tripartite tricarboxylate transporter substrate binding protein [Betaproteobacteria bacterium]
MNASVFAVLVTLLMGLAWPVAGAGLERYPTKPLRIVVPFAPGGSNDLVGRVVAQKLNEAWGQPAIIDNRPGAGSTIGIEIVVRAAPDGYTLLTTSGGIASSVTLYRLSFNPVTDLAPVVLMAQMPYLLAVHPSVPAKSTQELIILAKAKPGQLIYASSGTGTSTHLTVEMFKSMAKVDMLHVPYKGGGPAVAALVSGEVQVIFNPVTAILPQARAGRVRPLAVSSAKRAEIVPELPTVAESGLPGFEVIAWYNMFAPAGTPRSIIKRINAEINRMLQQPDVRKHFLALGVVPLGGTPEALGNYLKFEIARWAKVIKDTGIKFE